MVTSEERQSAAAATLIVIIFAPMSFAGMLGKD